MYHPHMHPHAFGYRSLRFAAPSQSRYGFQTAFPHISLECFLRSTGLINPI